MTLRGRLRPLCLWAPWVTGCALESADTELTQRHGEAVVYGADDRVDVHSAPEPFAALAANAAVALIHPDRLRAGGDDTYTLDAPLLGDAFSLCAGERFADQPSAANCSGVLIAEDLVATSGHCLTGGSANGVDCSQHRFVFGYYLAAPLEPVVIRTNDIYECSHVVTRVISPSDSRCRWDLAVVRLTRSVDPPRAPVRFRAGAVEMHEALAVIGFSSGLPAKVDRGARVLDARTGRGDYFTLNSDTFSVSSGSGVFDGTGQLVGLFARGEADFEQVGDCQRVRVIEGVSSTAFEEATKIDAVRSALQAATDGRRLPACESNSCALEACGSGNGMPAAGDPRGAGADTSSCGVAGNAPRSDACWFAVALASVGALAARRGRRPCPSCRRLLDDWERRIGKASRQRSVKEPK